MKKVIAILVGATLIAGTASADLIATWGSFTGGDTAVLTINNDANNADELTISNLGRGGGTLGLQTTLAGNYLGNNWTSGGYFFFTLEIEDGFQLTGATLSYRVNGTATGPGTMGWSINFGSAVGGGRSITGSFADYEDSLGTLGPGLYTISYAPVGTLNQAGTGAFAAGGGIRLNDSITLSGTIVPEPSSVLLIGLGLIGMVAGRRALRK